MNKGMVPYSFKIKGGLEQDFETTAEKIERAKEIYNGKISIESPRTLKHLRVNATSLR